MGKELCLWLIRYTLLYTVQPAHYFLFSSLHQTIAKPTSSSLKVEKQREKKNLANIVDYRVSAPFLASLMGSGTDTWPTTLFYWQISRVSRVFLDKLVFLVYFYSAVHVWFTFTFTTTQQLHKSIVFKKTIKFADVGYMLKYGLWNCVLYFFSRTI